MRGVRVCYYVCAIVWTSVRPISRRLRSHLRPVIKRDNGKRMNIYLYIWKKGDARARACVSIIRA